jgi:hypothetical protein
MKKLVFLFLLVCSVAIGQDFPLDKNGNIKYERVIEAEGTQIERAVGWMVDANIIDKIYFMDINYGKIVFSAHFPTYGVDGRKGKLDYSGDVNYICTLLVKGDKCKVVLSNFIHSGDLNGIPPYGRGSLSIKDMDMEILTQPDWMAWYRLRHEAELKINALLNTL